MGVYIKNMKAPVTCSYCPLIGYDPDIEWNDGGMETQGAYICVMTHELIDNTKREDHCPLVPVPPHGRLIDADALIKELEITEEDDHNGATLLMAIFIEVLKSAPTIIQASGGKEDE